VKGSREVLIPRSRNGPTWGLNQWQARSKGISLIRKSPGNRHSRREKKTTGEGFRRRPPQKGSIPQKAGTGITPGEGEGDPQKKKDREILASKSTEGPRARQGGAPIFGEKFSSKEESKGGTYPNWEVGL